MEETTKKVPQTLSGNGVNSLLGRAITDTYSKCQECGVDVQKAFTYKFLVRGVYYSLAEALASPEPDPIKPLFAAYMNDQSNVERVKKVASYIPRIAEQENNLLTGDQGVIGIDKNAGKFTQRAYDKKRAEYFDLASTSRKKLDELCSEAGVYEFMNVVDLTYIRALLINYQQPEYRFCGDFNALMSYGMKFVKKYNIGSSA